MNIDFTFSDTIAGYVTGFNSIERWVTVMTSDRREFKIYLTQSTYGHITYNLGESYLDATGILNQLLALNRQFVYVYGTFYPNIERGPKFEAQWLVFPGKGPGVYRHEEPDWWIKQIHSIGTNYLKWQFNYPEEEIDYRNYRTFLQLSGEKKGDYLQETDTISRLVYGFASAYLLTGEEPFLEAAEKGTEYLREHMRFYDQDEGLIYWYHGIKVQGEKEHKLLTSEFGDDYDSLPMYEQIYALAGPTQTYRITGDTKILWDIEKTIELFDKFYKDNELGGYFSHIDPIELNPRAESLGQNRARKNWNSVGDHAPAYLINLYLATGKREYADMLEYTFDTIVSRFQDYENSPFVQERFYEDWSHDKTWGWQQNRAVVGHNLKIAWNLMRMYSLKPKDEYVNFARKIAEIMPKVGCDLQRGGWYDVVEREIKPDGKHHRFAWHDRKAWWQQEQAILAYLILHGILKDEEYLRLAREATAYYNAFFPDHDDGGIYFNTLANGLPYLLGNERLKGSHSMSGYHSMELCYLSSVYINLLITKQPMYLYFKPYPNSFKDNILSVSPDILPDKSISIDECYIDDELYKDYDSAGLTIKLPDTQKHIRVKVKLVPKTWLD
ncbi:MAG: N-acyl-D-glucosamine 2-epimerase [Nitrospirae bacterium RBG_13_39_12]|nr:MAG: N-acyl-D-glucosamine 2-epimerase [Nitrospirae bacterium RBG_13_39_12]